MKTNKRINKVLLSIIVLALVIGEMIIQFRNGMYIPEMTISYARVSRQGDLLVGLSNGLTVNAGSVNENKDSNNSTVSSVKLNDKNELVVVYSNGTEDNLGRFEIKDSGYAVTVENAEIRDNGDVTIHYSNGETALFRNICEESDIRKVTDSDVFFTLAETQRTLEASGQLFNNFIIATGEKFPDALGGGCLSFAKRAPILLIKDNAAVQSTVQDMIKKYMKPEGTIYVLGGERAVATSWLGDLPTKYTVKRLDGATRYETNISILKEIMLGDGMPGSDDSTGISNIEIINNELVISLSDGEVINLGNITGKDGISVSETKINDKGELVITLSDGTTNNLGVIVGAKGETGEKGADGKDGIGIEKSEINEKGELIVTYTNHVVDNLGSVVGAKGEKGDKGDKGEKGDTGENGKDGVGISTINITDEGNMEITLSNGNTLSLGNVKGKDGINGKDGANGKDGVGITSTLLNDKGELVITLSDGTEKNVGAVSGKDGIDGKDGVGISSISLNESGELVITLSNGTTNNVGKVVGEKGETGATGAAGQDGKGISGVSVNENNELVVILTDDTTINAGTIPGKDGEDGVGIKDVTLSESGELVITLTDDTVKNLGTIKGEKGDKGDKGDPGQNGANGKDGKGISNVTIDASGNLTIIYTDTSTQNVGNIAQQLSQSGFVSASELYYNYTILNDGTAQITGLTELGKTRRLFAIPTSIEGHTVTEIGDGDNYIFYHIDPIENIIIPETVSTVYADAFQWSSNYDVPADAIKIHIPLTVETIDCVDKSSGADGVGCGVLVYEFDNVNDWSVVIGRVQKYTSYGSKWTSDNDNTDYNITIPLTEYIDYYNAQLSHSIHDKSAQSYTCLFDASFAGKTVSGERQFLRIYIKAIINSGN